MVSLPPNVDKVMVHRFAEHSKNNDLVFSARLKILFYYYEI
jgi:hypothetical protein